MSAGTGRGSPALAIEPSVAGRELVASASVYGHYSGRSQPLLHAVYPRDVPPAGPPSGELVTNGGFEDGPSGWTTTGPVEISNAPEPPARTGAWRARFSAPDGAGELRQTGIRIPDQADVELTFQLLIVPDGTYADAFEVWISTGEQGGDSRLLREKPVSAKDGYIEHRFDVTAWAGEEVTLTFSNDDNGATQAHTHWYLDDVSLTAGSG